MVSAELIPLAEALPLLLSTSGNLRTPLAWRPGLGRGRGRRGGPGGHAGRLLPTVSAGDMDVCSGRGRSTRPISAGCAS